MPTYSRPLILVKEQVLLPPGSQHHEGPSALLQVPQPHGEVLVSHPQPLPARWRWPSRLGAAAHRAAEPGVCWVEGVHQTHAGRELVQPVSSYCMATFPYQIHLSHAPQELHQVVGHLVTTGAENNIIQVSFPNLCGSVE